MYTRKTSAQAIIYIARRVFQKFPKKMFFILSKLCPFSGILLHRYANRAPIIFNNNTLWRTPSPSAPVTFLVFHVSYTPRKVYKNGKPNVIARASAFTYTRGWTQGDKPGHFPQKFWPGAQTSRLHKKKQCVKMYSYYNNTAQLVYTTHDITIFYQKYVSNCHHD